MRTAEKNQKTASLIVTFNISRTAFFVNIFHQIFRQKLRTFFIEKRDKKSLHFSAIFVHIFQRFFCIF